MQAVTHKKPSLNSPISRPEADSELPKIHGGRPSWRGLRRRLCWGLLGVLVLAVAVLAMRQVYNASFLIDDILEVKEIRGYYTSEKFTIRTRAPADLDDLKAFVEHYTICPQVEEIRVAWWSAEPEPAASVFTFTKAHSAVVFDRIKGTFSCNQKAFVTPSIILLDSDVFVECSDIKYLGEVFQSTSNALVGYYPRLHRKIGDFQYEFLGRNSVVWNKAYSILLAAGLMIDTRMYNSVCDESEPSKRVQEILAARPQCFDVLFSVWVAHKGGSPPVWVPVSPSTRQTGSVATPWTAVSDAERSRCLTSFSEATGVKHLSSSYHKAADARNELFW